MNSSIRLTLLVSLAGLVAGIGIGAFLFHQSQESFPTEQTIFTVRSEPTPTNPSPQTSNETIGFLPYWLVDKARENYQGYITTLTYFGLTVDTDGTIRKFTNVVESEPGWYALHSGKMDNVLVTARKNNQRLSLLIFNGDPDEIDELLSDPETHAKNLVDAVIPVIQQYGFTNLNLDIENVKDATDEERNNFTSFVKTVDAELAKQSDATLTIDMAASDFIQKHTIDPVGIGPYVDSIIIMAYDYHYAGSYVTGPVAPLSGAGTVSEYDIETAVSKMLQIIPPQKIRLGIPLYGYEWETIGTSPRSAVIPGTGITASNERVEQLLIDCPTCTVGREKEADEPYVIYTDKDTGVMRQIFYPDQIALQHKLDFAKENKLGGTALWALGYEGKQLLEPLKK